MQLADGLVIDMLFLAKLDNSALFKTLTHILERFFDFIRNDGIMSPNVPYKLTRRTLSYVVLTRGTGISVGCTVHSRATSRGSGGGAVQRGRLRRRRFVARCNLFECFVNCDRVASIDNGSELKPYEKGAHCMSYIIKQCLNTHRNLAISRSKTRRSLVLTLSSIGIPSFFLATSVCSSVSASKSVGSLGSISLSCFLDHRTCGLFTNWHHLIN